MTNSLVLEAQQIASEYGLAIFPVTVEKRPLVKGWQTKATKDRDEIAELFALDGAAGVGVPCGPDNDIICFDLDYGHDPSPEQVKWLKNWENEISRCMECTAEQPQMHTTRSGGKHILMCWPENVERTPRNIMPKLEVIGKGFYFVWPTGGSGYKIEHAEQEWPVCPLELLEVWKDAFPQGQGSGWGLVSAEEAHEAMMSNGSTGERHKALLRMTHDWAAQHPEDDLRDLCEGFEQWFRDIYAQYIDEKRLDKLLAWRMPTRPGDKPEGELGRAFAGAFMTPQRANAALEEALLSLPQQTLKQALVPLRAFACVNPPPKVEMADDTLPGLEWLTEPLPGFDWLVPGLIERGKILGLAGTSNAGKTRWLTLFVAALASGRPDVLGIVDQDFNPIRIMMVANEESNLDLKRRLKATCQANGLTPQVPITFCGQGWLQDAKGNKLPHTALLRIRPDQRSLEINEHVVAAIIKRARDTHAQILTFDPYVTLGVGNENAQYDNNVMFGLFRRIADETGAAVLFIHHAGKGDSRTESPDAVRGMMSAFRGSSVITSSMDIGFTLLPFMIEKRAGKNPRHQRVANLIRTGQLTNYVVLDWCKVREGQMGPAVYYKIVSHTLPEGFDVGVMALATEEQASLEHQQAMSGGAELAAALCASSAKVAEVLADVFEDGDHLSFAKMHEPMRERAVAGWPDRKMPPRNQTHPSLIATMNDLCASPAELPDGRKVQLSRNKRSMAQKHGPWRLKITHQVESR